MNEDIRVAVKCKSVDSIRVKKLILPNKSARFKSNPHEVPKVKANALYKDLKDIADIQTKQKAKPAKRLYNLHLLYL